MSSFNYFTFGLLSFSTLVIKGISFFPFKFEGFHSGTQLERLTIFILGLGDLDDSAIFKLSIFQNIFIMCLKCCFKNKANYNFMLLPEEKKLSRNY